MVDRIACSCVTCFRCGSWVVVTQPTRVRTGEDKLRASCPVSECGKEFVFRVKRDARFRTAATSFRDRARGLSLGGLAKTYRVSRTTIRRVLTAVPKGSAQSSLQPEENKRPETAA